MKSVRQKFEMHRCFVRRPSEQIVWVDNPEWWTVSRGESPPHEEVRQRKKTLIFVGSAIQNETKAKRIILQALERIGQILMIDEEGAQVSGLGSGGDQLKEIPIVLPVPHQANVMFLSS